MVVRAKGFAAAWTFSAAIRDQSVDARLAEDVPTESQC